MTSEPGRWNHLDPYEQRYLKPLMQAYDEIMAMTEDITTILESLHSEQKFMKALQLCQSIVEDKCKPSTNPCEAIHLFCEVGKDPLNLLSLSEQYAKEIKRAEIAVEEYARTIDNWKVGNCPFGVKDHCKSFVNF